MPVFTEPNQRIAIGIVERLPTDADLLEVAEVHPRETAAAEQDIRGVGGGAHPADWRHFTHPIRSGCQIGESVVAIAVGQRAGFAGIEHAVVIAVEEDGPAEQAGLARILAAVAVDIIECLAADAIRLEVAEAV